MFGKLVIASIGVGLLGYLFYTPLPPQTRDPGATQLIFAIFRLMGITKTVREYLGYGTFTQDYNIWRTPVGEGHLKTAANTDMDVKWDKMNGVPVVVYRPLPAAQLSPAIVYIHGGGFVLGSATEFDLHTYNYAKRSGAVVISVDYRLAPEAPFPAAIEDSLAVTRYVLQHGGQLGVDVTKVGVAGDSAGGNLAASVAYKLRDETDLPPLLFQVLHVPFMQALDLQTPSKVDNFDDLVLSSKFMAQFIVMYLGMSGTEADKYCQYMMENRQQSEKLLSSKYMKYVDRKLLPAQFQSPKKANRLSAQPADPVLCEKVESIITSTLFSPLMADDLSGLPPTFIQVSENDVLRDDGLFYAKRLTDAGVNVKLHILLQGLHVDYNSMIDFPPSVERGAKIEALNETFKFINNQLNDDQ